MLTILFYDSYINRRRTKFFVVHKGGNGDEGNFSSVYIASNGKTRLKDGVDSIEVGIDSLNSYNPLLINPNTLLSGGSSSSPQALSSIFRKSRSDAYFINYCTKLYHKKELNSYPPCKRNLFVTEKI